MINLSALPPVYWDVLYWACFVTETVCLSMCEGMSRIETTTPGDDLQQRD